MNAALNSGTVSSRPAIWRRSKSYRKKLFKRFMIGLPIVTTCGWEYRVWKRKLYYDRNREHFPGSTPFYGKLWGYESDYMIETSLNDGDLVFWSVDPLSIHVWEAVARFAYRHLKGDYDCWDFCGVVVKSGGQTSVITSQGDVVPFSELVADYRTSSLVVRTLIDTSRSGEERFRIKESLVNMQTQVSTQLPVGFVDFGELSLKAIAKAFLADASATSVSKPVEIPQTLPFFVSLLRPASISWPLSLLSGLAADEKRITEISELFMDPLIFRDGQISYAPPFFVRRLDNEYYTHNRTKNIVVDWNLLQQRAQKNKFVAKHQQNEDD